jgi:glycosyltransferase involved in cell wall biosynthesis
MKLLTIAIPTFNRYEFAEKQLNFVVEQIKINSLEQYISVLIIDNCSPDNTQERLNSVYHQSFLTILRNEENIGLVANCLKCIIKSESKYTWVVGDDDPLGDSTIPSIIEILLKDQEVGLIHINHKCIDKSNGPIIIDRFYNIQNDSKGKTELINSLLSVTHTGGFMFITANVIKTEFGKQIIESSTSIKSMLSYPMYLYLSCGLQHGIYIISSNDLTCVYNQSSWVLQYQRLMTIELPRLWLLLNRKGLSKKNINQLIINHSYLLSPFMIQGLKDVIRKRNSLWQYLTTINLVMKTRLLFRFKKVLWMFQ